MNQNQLATVGFFFGLLYALVGGVCSLNILRKMRSRGFGVSDLWDPTGKLYRGYVQEAKLQASHLPLYIPAVLGVLLFYYLFIALTLVLRAVL